MPLPDPMATVQRAIMHYKAHGDAQALKTAADAVKTSDHPRAPLAHRLATAAYNNCEKLKDTKEEPEKLSGQDDKVGKKISKLVDEGKPQKQAVAIALDMDRKHKLAAGEQPEKPGHFVVTGRSQYEGDEVKGVHTNLEDAKKHAQRLQKDEGQYYDRYSVHEWNGEDAKHHEDYNC